MYLKELVTASIHNLMLLKAVCIMVTTKMTSLSTVNAALDCSQITLLFKPIIVVSKSNRTDTAFTSKIKIKDQYGDLHMVPGHYWG